MHKQKKICCNIIPKCYAAPRNAQGQQHAWKYNVCTLVVFCLFACVCMYIYVCTCICVMFIFSQECKAWNSELLLLVVRQILHCLHSPHTQPRVTVVGNPWFAPYSRLLSPCDRNFRRFWRSLRAADLCHVSSSSCLCDFVVNHNS